jgi:hypothetical protein
VCTLFYTSTVPVDPFAHKDTKNHCVTFDTSPRSRLPECNPRNSIRPRRKSGNIYSSSWKDRSCWKKRHGYSCLGWEGRRTTFCWTGIERVKYQGKVVQVGLIWRICIVNSLSAFDASIFCLTERIIIYVYEAKQTISRPYSG